MSSRRLARGLSRYYRGESDEWSPLEVGGALVERWKRDLQPGPNHARGNYTPFDTPEGYRMTPTRFMGAQELQEWREIWAHPHENLEG